MSVTRSAFGSSTNTLLPALISAIMRCSMAVDLPEPVGPSSMVCSSESFGEMLSFFGMAPTVSAKTLAFLSSGLGSLYQLGGFIRFGCSPGTPAYSSSPAGSSKNGVISFTDNLKFIFHGRYTVFKCSGLSGRSLKFTPADCKVLKADTILSTRPSAFLPLAPIRMMVWNWNWPAFSLADLTLSADAFFTPDNAKVSQDSCGSCILSGTALGGNPLPSTTCTTAVSPFLVADIAASPCLMTAAAVSALRESTGLLTERYLATETGLRTPTISLNSIPPCALISSSILPLYLDEAPMNQLSSPL